LALQLFIFVSFLDDVRTIMYFYNVFSLQQDVVLHSFYTRKQVFCH